MNGRLHRFEIISADGIGDDDVCAKCDSDEEIDDQGDDGTVCSDGRNGSRPHRSREVAGNGHVSGVVHLLKNRSQCNRQCKHGQSAPDRTVQHVYFEFH